MREKDLDDMGDEGDKAGGEIKEAIKGALAAFIGFEAIQAGIDMLKGAGRGGHRSSRVR